MNLWTTLLLPTTCSHRLRIPERLNILALGPLSRSTTTLLSYRVEPLRRPSIGDLAEQLIDDCLIEACVLTKDRITIVQNSNRHTFPHKHARAFMMAMMGGRPWSTITGGDGASDQPAPRLASPSNKLRSALDDLAAMASEMNLIAGFERLGNGCVRVGLSACESELQEQEAAAFLADCIHHHLKAMRADAQPQAA